MVGQWAPWETCSQPCGSGVQMRTRKTSGSACPWDEETVTCNEKPCVGGQSESLGQQDQQAKDDLKEMEESFQIQQKTLKGQINAEEVSCDNLVLSTQFGNIYADLVTGTKHLAQ